MKRNAASGLFTEVVKVDAMAKLFYSTSEVANLFRVNRVTIYRWVKNGKVKAYGIGKQLKIPLS